MWDIWVQTRGETFLSHYSFNLMGIHFRLRERLEQLKLLRYGLHLHFRIV